MESLANCTGSLLYRCFSAWKSQTPLVTIICIACKTAAQFHQANIPEPVDPLNRMHFACPDCTVVARTICEEAPHLEIRDVFQAMRLGSPEAFTGLMTNLMVAREQDPQ